MPLLLRAQHGQLDVALSGQAATIGRTSQCGITSLKVSRQHCIVRCDAASSTEAAVVEPVKRVGVELGDGSRRILDPGASFRLRAGDKLYLLTTAQGGGDWSCAYQLQLTGTLPAQAAGATAAGQPQPAAGKATGTGSASPKGTASTKAADKRPTKRHKPAHKPAAPLSDVIPPATPISPARPTTKPPLAPAIASKRPARASALSKASTASRSQANLPQATPQHPPIFKGCHLTFWARSHAAVLVSKVAQLGAVVEDTMAPSTTHVIARYDTTAEEAGRKLEACPDLEYAALNSGSEPTSVLPLPRGVHFVTPQYLSDCIAKGQRLPEEQYHIHLYSFQPQVAGPQVGSAAGSQEAPDLAASAPSQGSLGPSQQPAAAETAASGAGHGSAGEAGAAPATTGRSGLGGADAAVATRGAAAKAIAPAAVATKGGPGTGMAGGALLLPAAGPLAGGSAPGIQGSSAAAGGGGQGVVEIAAGGTADGPAGGGGGRPPPPQFTEKGMLVPPPEEVCPSVEEWGVGGRWVEPWDEGAARECLQKLLSHWHKYQVHVPQAGHKARASGEAGLAQAAGQSPLRQASSSFAEAAATTAAAGTDPSPTSQAQQGLRCMHAACRALAGVCVVEELQNVRGSYLPGKRDEFRVKAINRAISVVSGLATPLMSEADVDALQLGTKTSAKLKEVLLTGRVERVAAMRRDDFVQTLALFLEVWGVAETTAERWYHQGCRTLEDAAKRSDLTETQRLGLKYFDDFQRRIPREEARECQRLVRGAVLEALEGMTGLPLEQLQDRLHVRITGSYLRGKKDCGDVDFVVAPPPAAADSIVPADLLHNVLQILLGKHLITPDSIAPRKVHRQMHESVTWLGVWKGPSSPCYRRIDIKIYPLAILPFAVNYFGSSKDFCKALRYWCNTPPEEVAHLAVRHHPQATAFKLNDKGLFPAVDRRMRRGGASEGVLEDVLGPSLPASCETDIFRAVGLSYIPPHMREI